MADDVVRVEGLTEFRKGLRQASRDLPKVLTKAHRTIAEMVVAAARPRMTTKTGRTARSAQSLRAGAAQGGAFIRALGPTAYGDEFGAKKFTQFKPHKGKEGYAIYPTIREEGPVIQAMYTSTVFGEIEARAFPD